jgi:hypothetical protein
MKRLIGLLISFGMVLSMAACGAPVAVSSQGSAASSQQTIVSESASASQPAASSSSEALQSSESVETEPDELPEPVIYPAGTEELPEGAVGYIDIEINPAIRLYFDFNKVIISVKFITHIKD